MAEFKLWGVYTPLLEQWTRDMGNRMEAYVDTNVHDIDAEYFDEDDPRVALYGWKNFPLFVAVKHGQPFQKVIGKRNWEFYEDWVKGLDWKREA